MQTRRLVAPEFGRSMQLPVLSTADIARQSMKSMQANLQEQNHNQLIKMVTIANLLIDQNHG